MSQLTARFQNIYNLEKASITIIGCGAIGSFTAMALARAGAEMLTLFDHDHVAPVNIGVQHFDLEHVGKKKVNMLANQIKSINPRAKLSLYGKRYGPDYGYYGSMFAVSRWHARNNTIPHFFIVGVDSMKARKDIVQRFCEEYAGDNDWLKQTIYYMDARMGSETFQMNTWELSGEFSAPEEDNFDYNEQWRRNHEEIVRVKDEFISSYYENWYSDENGSSEPCNARSTNYCASMAAAFICNQVRKIIDKRSMTDDNIVFNFPSMILESDTTRLNFVAPDS